MEICMHHKSTSVHNLLFCSRCQSMRICHLKQCAQTTFHDQYMQIDLLQNPKPNRLCAFITNHLTTQMSINSTKINLNKTQFSGPVRKPYCKMLDIIM